VRRRVRARSWRPPRELASESRLEVFARATKARSRGALRDPEARRDLALAEPFELRENEDDTELLYLISEFYDPSLQRGVRWDDPGLDIAWPAEPTVISERDRSFPDFAW
jgi:hypothetical protein